MLPPFIAPDSDAPEGPVASEPPVARNASVATEAPDAWNDPIATEAPVAPKAPASTRPGSPIRFKPASLKSLNSFGIDARAARLVAIDHVDQIDSLLEALNAMRHTTGASAPPPGTSAQPAVPGDLRPFILGGGSNLVLTTDVQRPVVQVRLPGRRLVGDGLVEVAAGENWDRFVDWTIDLGLAGIENLALIPGTCGAAPWQNIGAYGAELSDVLDSVEALDLLNGERRRFSREDCAFGYRDSVFKRAQDRLWLILSMRLQLQPASRAGHRIDYAGIREALGNGPVTTRRIADAVRAVRRLKLPDPAVEGNAGSFFKNPMVSPSRAASLLSMHPRMPVHPLPPPNETVKLSAAWLIETCGLKGFRIGDAAVSKRHALVIVNVGAATGGDIVALAQHIQQQVLRRFDVVLEPEPVML